MPAKLLTDHFSLMYFTIDHPTMFGALFQRCAAIPYVLAPPRQFITPLQAIPRVVQPSRGNQRNDPERGYGVCAICCGNTCHHMTTISVVPGPRDDSSLFECPVLYVAPALSGSWVVYQGSH